MAGYIGKSLAAGGTAVDAYSKTQSDAAYLKLTGGLMTGGVRQGISSLSADTTITTSHPNVILVTTAGSNRTMTLPAASAVGGQVYRFVKVDTGVGKLIMARAGSDTMGVSGTTSMELWYKDNYVDLMSDGSSRWIVMSSETFYVPTDSRDTDYITGLAWTTTLTTWTSISLANYAPVGTSYIYYFQTMQSESNSNAVGIYFRPHGSSETDWLKAGHLWGEDQDTDAHDNAWSDHGFTEVGYNCGVPTIEYYMVGTGSSYAMAMRGYRLG